MEPLTIPPSPNWYESKIAICAPDNTLIYGANNSIVIVKPAPSDKPSEISLISFAHLQKVHALALAPTWNDQHRVIASSADDKIVKVWNLLDNTCIYSHKAHAASKSRLVGTAFVNDTKLVSVTEDGYIIVWQMTTNQFQVHKSLLGMKVHVSALSACPHSGTIVAFGMRNGLVVITDLKGHGNVLYKLRAHEREVVDFAWCPTPFNIIPDMVMKRKPLQIKDMRDKDEQIDHNAENVDPNQGPRDKDTIDAKPANGTHLHCAIDSQMHSQQEIGSVTSHDPVSQDDVVETASEPVANDPPVLPKPKLVRKNPWANLKHADDDELPEEPAPAEEVKEALDTSNDFLKECMALRARIIETKDEDNSLDESLDEGGDAPENSTPRRILQASRTKKEKVIDAAGDGPPAPATTSSTPVSVDSPPADIVSDLVSDATSPEATINEVVDRPDKVESPKSEFLLASSARGGHIVIWRAGTDGRVQRRMRLAKPKTRGNAQYRLSNNVFVSLHWVSPEKLLSSGMNGELMVWNVTDQMPTPRLIHNDHVKQLFCITSSYCHERDSYSKWEDLAVWTIGQDRTVILTMLHSRKVLACYPTFACTVLTSAASTITPTRTAFGLSDGFIRFWDLSKENNQCIEMNPVKTKVGGRVMSLAWHTSQEYLLAFGTEDGQVGHVNAGQCKKPPVYFAQPFLTAIHKLEWAPLAKKSADEHGLYCCAEGQLAVFDFDQPLVNPETVKTPKGERVTNFAWKSDYSKLAIGCKSGTVYILDAAYEVKTTLYYQKNAIVSMAWHPMQTAEDEEQSPNHDWIASATSSGNAVVIFDIGKVSDELCMKEVIAGELLGHVKYVNEVFWSPYKNGVVATASEDGTVTVWKGMQPISTFLNNNAEPVLSGMWSPLNEDIIISSGKDNSLRVWNVKNHPTKEQNAIAQTRLTRKKNLSHCRALKDEHELETGSKSRRFPLLADISVRQSNLKAALADCRVMFEHYSGEEIEEENIILKLFGDPNGASEIIDMQKEAHKLKGRHGLSNHLQMWTGNVGETIKKAITDGNLTPWLLSVAPMISFSLWQEAVEAYARQLADSAISDPVEIASYYLTLHKLDEAIDILNAKQMHREALVLAKFKKPDDADLHKQILIQWARTCVMSGRFEVAAQSFMAQGQFEDAACVLYRRSDLPSLALAVELARFAGNDTLANTIQYRHDGLEAQVEDKVQLPSRIDLALEQARQAADAEEQKERAAPEGSDRASGAGDDIDKNVDRGNNSGGDIRGGEEKPAESDNREVDAADNEPAQGAKSNVDADAADNHAEGMEKSVIDADRVEVAESHAN